MSVNVSIRAESEGPLLMLWTALQPTDSFGFRFELEESDGSR